MVYEHADPAFISGSRGTVGWGFCHTLSSRVHLWFFCSYFWALSWGGWGLCIVCFWKPVVDQDISFLIKTLTVPVEDIPVFKDSLTKRYEAPSKALLWHCNVTCHCSHVHLPDLVCLVHGHILGSWFYPEALASSPAQMFWQARGQYSPNIQNGPSFSIYAECPLTQMLVCGASVQEKPLSYALWLRTPGKSLDNFIKEVTEGKVPLCPRKGQNLGLGTTRHFFESKRSFHFSQYSKSSLDFSSALSPGTKSSCFTSKFFT